VPSFFSGIRISRLMPTNFVASRKLDSLTLRCSMDAFRTRSGRFYRRVYRGSFAMRSGLSVGLTCLLEEAAERAAVVRTRS
jgi:hypothetical protein